MKKLRILYTYSVFLLFFGTLQGGEVMSWVPPYSTSTCLRNLDLDLGPYSPKTVLTALGLQFWRPTSTGGIIYEDFENIIDDDMVRKFQAKCKPNGIKVLLCIYNNHQANSGWDWNLAVQAFKHNTKKLANALYNECKRLGLDGVDIDFEGLNGHDQDRAAFAEFIKELGTLLKQDNLLLTVDTFHSPCYNAPNMAWWADWVGYVDYMHSMGYGTLAETNNSTIKGSCPSDSSETGKAVFKFSYQMNYGIEAGHPSTAVSVGLPTRTSFQGKTMEQHLQDIIDLPHPISICFWDFSLGSAWKKASVWELANKIKYNDPISINNSVNSLVKPVTVRLNNRTINLSIESSDIYSIKLYSSNGKEISHLQEKYFPKGVHQLSLSHLKLAKNVYYLSVQGHKISHTEKILFK